MRELLFSDCSAGVTYNVVIVTNAKHVELFIIISKITMIFL